MRRQSSFDLAPAAVAFLLMLGVAATAAARQADGTLGLIWTPNNGVPAISGPGGEFSAVLRERLPLHLVAGETRIPLAVDWSELPGGFHMAACSVPEDAAPGAYALLAAGDTREEEMPRAVYLYESIPDYYVFAHISDTHVGSGRHPRSSEEINRDVVQAVNESDAHFAIITGDLTENGTAEQFRSFLEILDEFTIPTFVCVGNHDRKDTNYQEFFGPLSYAFRFGPDGFLAFDTKDYYTADELGPQDGQLQILRREIKPARWSIGFSHRYEANMGMRSQLTLFVDDPLDYLFFGHWHRENRPDQTHVPWGTTQISVVPAAINGQIRLVEMFGPPTGAVPRPVQTVAETGRPPRAEPSEATADAPSPTQEN